MRLTATTLKDVGLSHLIQGTPIAVPYLFKGKIELLYQDKNQIIAFICDRYINDYPIYGKVMILLNQLVRYYHRPIILYCLSYRTLVSQEKIYLTFKKSPIDCES